MAVRSSIAANGDTELALVTKPRRTTNRLSFHFGNAVPTPRSFAFYQMLHKQGTGPETVFISSEISPIGQEDPGWS